MNVTIHTPTPDLAASLAFYKKLGFERFAGGTADDTSVLLSCDTMVVEINPDRFARAGVRLSKPSWSAELKQLAAITTVVPTSDGQLVVDPSGVWVYLTEGSEGAAPSPPDSARDAKCLLGNFAGISLETSSLDASLRFWRILGFETEGGPDEEIGDQGWMAAKSGSDFGISWMKPNSCPHLFFNPSLTFFNSGKNLEVIERIRAEGIKITEEITGFNDEGIVDNVIVRDPGGYGFFVFND